MSFGIIRVRELRSTTDVANSEIHNGRQYDSYGLPTPENIKPTETMYRLFTHSVNSNCSTANEAISARFKETGVKVRTDSVLALEYVVSLSPDAMKKIGESYSTSTLLDSLVGFVIEKHGNDNLISVSKHFDESNPHAHVIVTPIIEKEVKWKNRRGEGVRKENRLSARDFTGNKGLLRQLQTDYHKYITTPNVDGFYLDLKKRFGVEIHRGVLAENQLKKYTKETIAEIGHLRAEIMQSVSSIEQAREMANKGLLEANYAIKIINSELAKQKQIESYISNTEKKFIEKNNELHKQIEKEQHFKDERNKDGKWKNNAGMKTEF